MASNVAQQVMRLSQHHGLKIGDEAMKDWMKSARDFSDFEVESAVDDLVYEFKKERYKLKPDIQDFRRALSFKKTKSGSFKEGDKKKSISDFQKEAFNWWVEQNSWAKADENLKIRSVAMAYIEALIRTQAHACRFSLPFVTYMALKAFSDEDVKQIDAQGLAICKNNLKNGFMDAEIKTRDTRKKWDFIAAPFEIENYNITIPRSIWQRMGVQEPKEVDIFAGAEAYVG